jgi:ribose transport system ATP-binding protein
MGSDAARMEGIDKSFSSVQVLFDVGLVLKPHEVLGLVGKNGAGKSTLMKILYGVERADRGTITALGESYDPTRIHKGQSKNIAMIFQEFSLIPTLNVAENIFLSQLQKTRLGLLDKGQCRIEAGDLLKTLHLDIDPDVYVHELSVAEKQSVEIAKALSEQKKILIMDEPTAALTSDQVSHLFRILRNLKEQGISIIYISHNIRQIFEICDRITIIKDGRNVHTSHTGETNTDAVIGGITGTTQAELGEQIRERTKEARIRRNLQPLLKVDNLHFQHKVKGVSFEIYPGEIVGIAGLTGSGRTEILEAIYGINTIREGRIFVDGEEVRRLKPYRALRKGVILIPDERQVKGLILEHSVMYNMILPILRKIRGFLFLRPKKGRTVSRELARRLNVVASSIDQRVASLSGGNQQKVVLSKAISTDSKILLLDDPTLGVDVESKQEIAKIVREYVASGKKAALFVSSELEMISEVCDRVLVLRDGRIVGALEKSENEVISESRLLSLV